jgi:hypothetical protein
MTREKFPEVESVSVPIRLSGRDLDCLTELQTITGLSRADLVRRACRYTLPKFLAGEVDILTLRATEKRATN